MNVHSFKDTTMFDFCQHLAKIDAPVYTLACLFEGGRISESACWQNWFGRSHGAGGAV
jgi:hypothetical protein